MRACTVENYSVIKKEEISPVVTPWMDQEGTVPSEIRERQILYDLTMSTI